MVFKEEIRVNFKGRAKNWDSEAMIKRSMVIADKISELIGTQKQISILDIMVVQQG